MKFSSLILLSGMLLSFPAWAATKHGTPARDADHLQRMLALAERSNGVYSVHEAAEAGNAEVLAARLAEHADPNAVDELGNTPLHLAARGNASGVVRLLLAAGADPQVTNAAGHTPGELCRNAASLKLLDAAARVRRREIEVDGLVKQGDISGVRKAIKAGMNPNALSADRKGTLLLSAVQAGKPEMLRLLLSLGADANACMADSACSALHLAAQRGSKEMVTALLQAGADPMKKAGNGATALHDAVWYNRLECVTALLPSYKDVNFSPDGGHNDIPINMAILRSRTEIVQAFLKAGLNPNDACFRAKPPLVLAASRGRADYVQMLLAAGADRSLRDASGKTAADYATPAMQAMLH